MRFFHAEKKLLLGFVVIGWVLFVCLQSALQRSKDKALFMEAGNRQPNISTMQTLVEHGANVNTRAGQYGETPLHIAAGSGFATSPITESIEAAKFLLSHGAQIDATDQYGNTPLMRACYNGRVTVVRLLISKGANINVQNDNGFSAIKNARYQQDTFWDKHSYNTVIQMLIAAGAKE